MKIVLIVLSLLTALKSWSCGFDEAAQNSWKTINGDYLFFIEEYSKLLDDRKNEYLIELGICDRIRTYDQSCLSLVEPYRFLVDKKTCTSRKLLESESIATMPKGTCSTSNAGISNNHQINPLHTFEQVICFEKESRGTDGLSVVLNVPNDCDGQAKVYLKRPTDGKRALIASWTIKYILNPNVYASFTNSFQNMNIANGKDDEFSLNIQLHSGNGKNEIFEASLSNPALLGYDDRHQFPKKRAMNCRFK